MKIAFFTNSLVRWSIDKCFEVASAQGYDAIEICGNRPHCNPDDMRQEDIDHIKELSKRYGLPLISFEPEMPYFTWKDPRWQEESREYFKKCIKLCKDLEIPMIVTAALQCSYETTVDEDWKMFIDCLKEFAEYSERIDGPVLILEPVTPWEGNILTRSDDILRAMKAVDSPKVKAMLDFAAPLTVGEPSSNYFEKLGRDLIHLHLVDCNRDSEDHLIFGDGELPLEELLHMLKSYGYDGYCTVEIFDEYRQEPILFGQKAIRVIRDAMENVGLS